MLVLSGKRQVAQEFFIEPTTGESFSLDCDEYLGIESLWNHKNYWINMQDCSQGVKVRAILYYSEVNNSIKNCGCFKDLEVYFVIRRWLPDTLTATCTRVYA